MVFFRSFGSWNAIYTFLSGKVGCVSRTHFIGKIHEQSVWIDTFARNRPADKTQSVLPSTRWDFVTAARAYLLVWARISPSKIKTHRNMLCCAVVRYSLRPKKRFSRFNGHRAVVVACEAFLNCAKKKKKKKNKKKRRHRPGSTHPPGRWGGGGGREDQKTWGPLRFFFSPLQSQIGNK